MYDVFISHSNQDKAVANSVCESLENLGRRCWIAPRDVRAGLNWAGEINLAIRSSKVLLLVLSNDSNTSRPVLQEIDLAFKHGVKIVVFRLANVVPSAAMEFYINSTHWLDASNDSVEHEIKHLVDALRGWLVTDATTLEPVKRCPCVLVLDTSSSMKEPELTALTAGIRALRDELIQDAAASQQVELAVVSFGNAVSVVQDFVGVTDFDPPVFSSSGVPLVGSAIDCALDLLEARRSLYEQQSIFCFRPVVLMVSVGIPTDHNEQVIMKVGQRVRQYECEKRIAFFPVGVGNVDLLRLSSISMRSPMRLEVPEIEKLFTWLSQSMRSISNSRPGERVNLQAIGSN